MLVSVCTTCCFTHRAGVVRALTSCSLPRGQYVELLDSVFMVLRKKTEQLSFLHVYHHCLLIWAWLYCLHLSGCVDTFFGAGCNAAIHVLMYSYYLLTALNVPCSWKRYLTVAQMAQFVACAGQSLNVLFTPDACPPSLPLTQLFVMVNMLFLFGRFYRVRGACADANATQIKAVVTPQNAFITETVQRAAAEERVGLRRGVDILGERGHAQRTSCSA